MFNFQLAFTQADDCEETLKLAQAEFNAGHFYGVSSILKTCIDKGFTKEQQQRAYLLLTQTYLLIDDPIAAEDSYLKLLKANPEFETDVLRDPIDVVYLSKKFTTAPIFSVYAKAGPNISIAGVIHSVNLFSSDGKNLQKSYLMKPGFQLSLGGECTVKENISISVAAQYMSNAYKYTIKSIFDNDVLVFDERQKWINIPLWIKYSFEGKRFKPFAVIGYSQNFLIGDKIDTRYSDRFSIGNSSVPSINNNLTLLYKRRTTNSSIFIGGGIKRKIGLNYWFADLRYSFGLKNQVNEKLYADYSKNYQPSLELDMRYTHIDDLFRLDNLAISVGYIHPFYKPRKLKAAHTISVLKKLRKRG